MKKFIVIFLLPLIGLAQNTKLEKQNGFANYTFGSMPTSFNGLTLEMEEAHTKLYSVDQTPIVIDGIEFEFVRLTFHYNKLAIISLQTKNAMEDKFLNILKEKFGEPNKSNAKTGTYEWLSNKIQLTFADNGYHKDATIDFYWKESYKK